MRSCDMKKYVNAVVVLDLINGKEVTARIKSVHDDYVTFTKPRMFVPIPNPQNPSHTSVTALPYGYPLHESSDEVTIDLSQVIMVFEPMPDHVTAYEQHTGSIVTAPAGILNDLPKFDSSSLTGSN